MNTDLAIRSKALDIAAGIVGMDETTLVPTAQEIYEWLRKGEQPAPEVMQFGTNQTTQPLKAKLTIPKPEWDRLKGLAQDAYPSAINSKPVSVGDLPVVTFDATLTKTESPADKPAHSREGETLWIKVDGGGYHAKAEIVEHTVREYAKDCWEACYRVRRGCQYETVWGRDEGVTWAWTRDGFHGPAERVGKGVASFSDPAESPAEPAKRVPQIKDVILHKGQEWLVYHVSKPYLWAVKMGDHPDTFEEFSFSKEGKEGGWTFKE